jgi:hypothetical protein
VTTGSPHIVVDLKEQFGNQLFQFAAAKQLELDGARITFSDRTKRVPGTPATGLSRLEQFTGAALPRASRWQEIATGYLPRTVFNSPFVDFVLSSPIVLPTVRRILPTPDFDPRPATLPNWSLFRLQGYFQHRTWFERSLPSVIASLAATTRETRASIPTFDLCVHLRRGDYIGHGWELSFDYYLRSLELMPKNIKTVVVTSDDQLAAIAFSLYLRSQGLEALTPTDVEVATKASSPRHLDPVLFDFCLMATAKNIIMSNSSFCWWATALGDSVSERSKGRTVAYPRGWVRFPDESSDGLVQPTWRQVARS